MGCFRCNTDGNLSRHSALAPSFANSPFCSPHSLQFFQIEFDHPLRRGEMSQPNHHLSSRKWSLTIATNHTFGITTNSREYSHLNAGAVPWTLVNCRRHPRSSPDFTKTSVAMAKVGEVAMNVGTLVAGMAERYSRRYRHSATSVH